MRQLGKDIICPKHLVFGMTLRCLDFPFDSVWFVTSSAYWQDDIEFEVRSRQGRLHVVDRVLCRWQNVELPTPGCRDRTQLYVGANKTGCVQCTFHRLLCVPTPSVFAYYSNPILPRDVQFRLLLLSVALSELDNATVLRFLLAACGGILTILGKNMFLGMN